MSTSTTDSWCKKLENLQLNEIQQLLSDKKALHHVSIVCLQMCCHFTRFLYLSEGKNDNWG